MYQNFTNIIALDMGSCTTKIFAPGSGILYYGDSFAAKNADNEYISVTDIKQLSGMLNPGFTVCRPVKSGEIADPETACAHLANVFSGLDILNRRSQIKSVICVKKGITVMQKEAFAGVARYVNIKDVLFIDGIIASAIGAGYNITGPEAKLIVDVGGDKTEAAVIAFSDTVTYTSVNIGGNDIDEYIMDCVL